MYVRDVDIRGYCYDSTNKLFNKNNMSNKLAPSPVNSR